MQSNSKCIFIPSSPFTFTMSNNHQPPSTNSHPKPNRHSKHPNNPFGPSSSKPFIKTNNQMNPSRVLEPTTQDHKMRSCFENIENGVKCSFEVQVIDDTALLDVSVFKKKKSDTGFANNARTNQESDGKVKKSKGFKKTSAKSEKKAPEVKEVKGFEGFKKTSAKNEKKVKEVKGFDGFKKTSAKSDKKAPDQVKEVKGFKGFKKTSGKVKAVYVRKDAKVANVVQEQKKVLSDSGLITVLQETDVSLNVAKGEDQEEEPAVELAESERVNENADVLKLNPETDVVLGKIEVEEDQDVIVGSKKFVYSREELEALRFVDEDGQTSKWIEVYCAFTPLVAREYTGLVVDTTRRYNREGSCGSAHYGNDTAIPGLPPVLPMCSVSSYRKIAPYDRVGFRSNFN